MKLKTLTLLLAATGLAAYPYLKRVRSRAATGDEGRGAGWVTLSGMQAALGDRASDGANESELDFETPQAGFDDSPNIAQRLRDEDVVRSPVAAPNGSEQLSGFSSQRSEEPVAPGLPDLTRGA